VIYVWCDALVNYISALGYGRDDELFKTFWPASVHVIGKDILRFHAAIWPAMLMSAGLPLPKALLVHGFITSGGHKMSKSLGNVIDPLELIQDYGSEAVRYYFAREISPFEDGDITKEKFKESYNAHLANGIGNLVSRIMKMAETHLDGPVEVTTAVLPEYTDYMNRFDVHKASDVVWSEIRALDQYIQDNQPFKVVKTDQVSGKQMITELVTRLSRIAYMLEPILPHTASRIHTCITKNKVPETPLFARKD
jgi:methionyl-tRNA synthetase